MEEIPQDQALEALNSLVAQLGAVMREEDSISAEQAAALEAVTEPIKKRFTPRLVSVAERKNKLVDQIDQLASTHWEYLIGLVGDKKVKSTLFLRDGTVAVRRGKPAIDITDEKLALESMRRRRWLKRFTQTKTTISKAELGKHKEDAAKLRGIEIVQGESLVIKPEQAQSELLRERPRHVITRAFRRTKS